MLCSLLQTIPVITLQVVPIPHNPCISTTLHLQPGALVLRDVTHWVVITPCAKKQLECSQIRERWRNPRVLPLYVKCRSASYRGARRRRRELDIGNNCWNDDRVEEKEESWMQQHSEGSSPAAKEKWAALEGTSSAGLQPEVLIVLEKNGT
jgi:hypothetical protein